MLSNRDGYVVELTEVVSINQVSGGTDVMDVVSGESVCEQ